MAVYWNIVPGFDERVKSFYDQPPEPDLTLDFEVGEKDFVNSGNASSEIKTFLKRLAVDPAIIRRIAIASYEAEINVTAHARGGKITANIYDHIIHIVFDDKGPGIKDIEQALIPGFSTADELVREMGFGAGLGLPNIKKNSDCLFIDSEFGRNTVLEILIYF